MKKQSNSVNEKIIRDAYQVAEVKDAAGLAAMFTEDGYFWDVGSDKKYYGNDIGKPVEFMAAAFSNMHRELLEFYTKDDENVVIVELRLQGTNDGPFYLESGTVPPSGQKMDLPCCDVWHLENGKIKAFHCYNYTVLFLKQIGAF
jgi:ketosteroid isomerase-like protein